MSPSEPLSVPKHYCYVKAFRDKGSEALHILNLGTTILWVVSYTPGNFTLGKEAQSVVRQEAAWTPEHINEQKTPALSWNPTNSSSPALYPQHPCRVFIVSAQENSTVNYT